MMWRGHRRRARAAKVAMAAGVEGGGVLLVVELQQRVGVGAVAGDQRGEVLEQHHLVGDAARRHCRGGGGARSVGGGGGAHRAGAGGLAVERQVVQHGEAVVGVDHEVDLDAGAERPCPRGCGGR